MSDHIDREIRKRILELQELFKLKEENQIIQRKIGERMIFTGGAEVAPVGEIINHQALGSLNQGTKIVYLKSYCSNQGVTISAGTMVELLKWLTD